VRLDASEGKSEGYERARATYSKIINRLHIFSRLFIYIEPVVVEVIKNFDYYFLRCNPSY
jgi:hypothetical protein